MFESRGRGGEGREDRCERDGDEGVVVGDEGDGEGGDDGGGGAEGSPSYKLAEVNRP